jgi:hypothetical protein
MLVTTGKRLVDVLKGMATQAGTRVARALVQSTVLAVRAVDRLRARVLGGAPHPRGAQVTERLWQDTVAPSPKVAGAVGPEATQALRKAPPEEAKAEAPRRPTQARRKKAPPAEAGRKTVQVSAPAGKRAVAPATPKKAGASPKKAGTRKKQAPRRRA